MDISNYDRFFENLEQKLRNASTDRMKVLNQAVKETQCPYLLSKLSALKQMYKVGALAVGLLLSLYSTAQVRFSVKDSETLFPLSGASIAISELGTSENFLSLTDPQGTFSSALSLPIALAITHVGYTPYRDTIFEVGTHEILLDVSEEELSEVVVTGQYQPQSARRSVYNVRTLDAKRIAAQGATNLQDVLSNELNMRFSRDNAVGSSGLTLQGLSGQNVKVLLDGVPMVGRSGTANEIDLGQINVQMVERIEIVEGPMSVNYGADALAGVINIITKKNHDQLQVSGLLQEETVGKEYSLFDDGIHNAAVSVGLGLGTNWSTQGEFRVNRFGGWTGNGEGRDKDWYPKTQYFTGGLIRFQRDKFDVYYRLDYLHELLENLGSFDSSNPITAPSAKDKEYLTTRWMHQLQANTVLGKASLNSVLSFTDYERSTSQLTKYMEPSGVITNNDGELENIYYQSFFTRQTVNNWPSWTSGSFALSVQSGLDASLDNAGGTMLSSGDKKMTTIGGFASAEIAIGGLKVRPGIRISYNSIFKTTPTPSVNLKYALLEHTQIRLGYGRGFRAPSLRELYHEFIDANHNIIGNQNLEPEYSHSFNASILQDLLSWNVSLSLTGFYNHVENQIDYFTPSDVKKPTEYVNIYRDKTTGGTFTAKYQKELLKVNAGISFIGRYQELRDTEEGESVPEFVFSPAINTNVTYTLSALKLDLALFYKYTGANKSYQLVEAEDSSEQPKLTKINDFHFLDITVNKRFEKGFSVGTGIRNALNVTSVNNTLATGGAHEDTSGITAVAYGRSFYLRLNYQFIK